VRAAVVAYGVLLLSLSVLGVVRPAFLIGLVERLWRSRAGLYLAVLIRIAVGVLLLAAASSTRFPGIVKVLGVLALVAAVSRLLVGHERYHKLIDWWAARGAGFTRAWSLIGALFSAFLIYVAT